MSELRAVGGRPIYIEATLVRGAAPVDTRAGGFKAWFTIKESKQDTDADAVFAADETDGILVDTPSVTDHNKLTIEIGDFVTSAYDESADLYWELVVDDPASARGPETIDDGILKLKAPVLRVIA